MTHRPTVRPGELGLRGAFFFLTMGRDPAFGTGRERYNKSAQSTTMTDVVIVLSTVPDEESGERLARALVDERLAACVNLHGPMVSVYRWKGKVEREAERQLVIKTTRDRVPALEARLKALHSYETPEFVIVSVEGGSQAYLDWVGETK